MWQCTECMYLYDPNSPLSGEEPFEELADNWVCPQCAAPKDKFEEIGGDDED